MPETMCNASLLRTMGGLESGGGGGGDTSDHVGFEAVGTKTTTALLVVTMFCGHALSRSAVLRQRRRYY